MLPYLIRRWKWVRCGTLAARFAVRALFAAFFICLAEYIPARAAVPALSKPDVLLIMPDQMRGDSLSIVGHPVVKTPNLDALALSGTLFRRGYTTVPSCIPARFALLTGLAPQSSGVVGYAFRPITTPTLPAILAEMGYATVLVGRNMHQAPESGSLGYQRQVLASTYVPGDEYDLELKGTGNPLGGIRQIVEALKLSNNSWPAKAWPLAEELHPTAWIVRRSREVIKQTPATQPLFLTASFYAPHPPLFPPARLFDRYLQSKLPEVAMGQWVDRDSLRPEGNEKGDRVLLQGDTLQRAQAGYFGLIEQLDEQLGPLMADFKQRSEKAGRPWAIFLVSDHGEMLGDHGYFRKCEPYEGSTNIPFVVAGSKELRFAAGIRSADPVCLEDIMPTVLELADGGQTTRMDGRSLVAALRKPGTPVRPWLHSEHAPTYSPLQAFQAINDGRMKFIWRPHSGDEQLFDLEQDPQEKTDLASLPAHRATRDRLRGVLMQRLKPRAEGFSDGHTLFAGRPYPSLTTPVKP